MKDTTDRTDFTILIELILPCKMKDTPDRTDFTVQNAGYNW